MKTKSFLLLVFATLMYAGSWAQCSTPPIYLNSAYETNNGFSCDFLIKQPVCDTVLGYELQWKGATDSYWSGINTDSFVATSDVLFGLGVVSPLNAGVKYQWRVRMITYKHNGNPSYSDWTKGTSFTPQVLAGSGCTYPGPISLFSPSAYGTFVIFSNPNPPPTGWSSPTRTKLQYKVDGTTGWSTVNNIDATGFYYYLDGLVPSTTYNWRMQNRCSSDGNSIWQKGPDFTTASAAMKNRMSSSKKENVIFNQSDVKHYADDETAEQVSTDVLKVTPNPASSQINISLNTNKTGNAFMTIKDLSGNVKWSASNVNVSSLKNMTVNVSNLIPGIYSLQLNGVGNTVISQKIIISR